MKKKAFLCGVNRYMIQGANLRGCVNDVKNIREALIDLYGFSVDDIAVITDFDATKANIQSGLENLIEEAVAGDVLYFHFSGHGSNVPDQDGDEADGRDEIFCPTDLDWTDPLRDDWVRDLLDTLTDGVNLTVVTDCCHSGSITRAIAPPDAIKVERYLPCPRDIWAEESRRNLSGTIRSKRRSLVHSTVKADVKDVELTEVLITGCRADQTSADAFLEGDYQGALTHALVTTLRHANGQLTYRELHQQVLQQLLLGGFIQTPQLEGRPVHFDAQFLTPFV